MTQTSTLVKTTHIPMRWGDMDAFGHLNNVAYLRFMEEVRVQWLTDLKAMDQHDGTGPIQLTANLTYLKPVVYPANLQVTCSIGELGNTSFMTYYTLSLESKPEEPVCEGEAKLVWFDYSKHCSVPVPDFIRTLF